MAVVSSSIGSERPSNETVALVEKLVIINSLHLAFARGHSNLSIKAYITECFKTNQSSYP
jgi:hypothetical protein